MLLCDFCSTPNPPRKYDCVPFVMAEVLGVEQWSDNAWAACEICAKLIDEDQWDELTRRSLSMCPFAQLLCQVDRRQYETWLRELHRRFRVAKGMVA